MKNLSSRPEEPSGHMHLGTKKKDKQPAEAKGQTADADHDADRPPYDRNAKSLFIIS